MLRSLIVHPPESNIALDLLNKAANHLVDGEFEEASQAIIDADIDSLREWFHNEAQASTKLLEHHSIQPTKPPTELKTKAKQTDKDFREIMKRDGWHCRFCDIRVVDPSARSQLSKLLPEAMKWGKTNLSKHACLAVLASPDHVLPRGWGGSNELDNLVTACWPCQFSRMEVRIEECGISDPRDRKPILDDWDGLTRVLKVKR